jgi:RNA polymerase sigma-70 factor (ECF subfamily)
VDAGSLIALLSAERARLVRLTRRRVPAAADAEDVVQTAMVRAAERARSLRDPLRLEPWFRQILQRTIADFYRSRTLEIALDSNDAHPSVGANGAAETGAEAENACACGLQLMATLRPAYADVLRRVDIDGQPPKAVAATLSISERNLHVRLHRARHALRERVRAHCGVLGLRRCLDCGCDAVHRCGRGTRGEAGERSLRP